MGRGPAAAVARPTSVPWSCIHDPEILRASQADPGDPARPCPDSVVGSMLERGADRRRRGAGGERWFVVGFVLSARGGLVGISFSSRAGRREIGRAHV